METRSLLYETLNKSELLVAGDINMLLRLET